MLYWEKGSSQKKLVIDERRNVFIEQNISIILINIKFKGIYPNHVLYSTLMFKSIRLYLFEFNNGDFYFDSFGKRRMRNSLGNIWFKKIKSMKTFYTLIHLSNNRNVNGIREQDVSTVAKNDFHCAFQTSFSPL